MSFVFISHRGTDKPRIQPFVRSLIDRGIPAWIDRVEEFNVNLPEGERTIAPEELGGGIELTREWPTQIDKALMQAFAVVVFWSRNWTRDRDILVREHGAAHMFGNVGYSTYIPVLLDEESQLDKEVLAYRQAVHDNVQAYNVARYGEVHWRALTDRLQELWKGHRQEQGLAPIPRSSDDRPLGSAGWLREVTSPREPQHTVSLLIRFPPGPAVDPWIVPTTVRRCYAHSISDTEAPLLVSEAAGLVLQTFNEYMRRKPEVLVVMRSQVPNVFHVGTGTYWSAVMDHACILGPRMMAALLLSANASMLRGIEQTIAEVLQQLEVWKC